MPRFAGIRADLAKFARMGIGAGALAIAAGAPLAAPAMAATPNGSITLYAPADLPIGAAGASGRAYFVYADSRDIHHGSVTFDVSQIAGFTRAEMVTSAPGGSGPAACPVSGAQITCALPDGDSWTPIEVLVGPTGAAAGGAHGAIAVTARADNADTARATSTVKVVDAPDLAVYTSYTNTKQKPGDKVSIPIAVANLGSRTANGLTFTFTLDHGLVPDAYSDCTYAGPNKYVTVVTCTTNLDLPTQQLVTLADFHATVAADAFGQTNATWVVTAQGDAPPVPQALLSGAQTRSAGHRLSDGAKLGPITKKPSAAARAVPDVNMIDNAMTARYTVENTVDIAAVGATTTAAPGSTIKVPVGGKNTGPGSVRMSGPGGPGDPVFKLTFVVPAGTEAVTVPDTCHGEIAPGNYGPADPGKPSYECYSNDTLYVGETDTVTFGLKVTGALPATGSVSVLSYATDGPDANPANDKASVVINAGAAAPSGGPSLPVTGAQTALIAGAGAAVLAVGTVLFLLARRRRVVLVTPEDHTTA